MPDPFEGVPKLEFRLYEEPDLMAKSYRSFTRNFRRLLANESGQSFEYVDDPSDYAGDPSDTCRYDKCKYTILILPRRHNGLRWFEVDIYPPPGWKEREPVRLMFLFHNLYLLGFYGGNKKWKFFGDAELDGISKKDIDKYIDILRFNGSYGIIGQNYKVFDIGFQGQLSTYNTLAPSSNTTDDIQLQKALCRVVVTISEAIRFLQLMQLLIEVFESGSERFLDADLPEAEAYKNISYHFQNWDLYCMTIRGGKKRYEEKKLPGFPEFRSFFSSIGVLLAKGG